MPDPLLYLQAIGATAIVSAIIVLAMASVRRPATATRMNAACVLAMAIGLTFGYGLLALRVAWPPVNGLDRFLTIVFPATFLIELIAGFERVPRRCVWLLRISLAAAIPRILLHGSVYLNGSADDWSLWQAGAVLVVSGGLLAVVWGLLHWLSRRSPGISIPLALGLTTQCAGLTVMMAGYIKGGAAAFPLAATLVATAIAAKLIYRSRWALTHLYDGPPRPSVTDSTASEGRRTGYPNVPFSAASGITNRVGSPANFFAPATIGIGAVGLFGLLFIGRFFGRLSTGDALTMLLAPLLCWITEIPLLRNRSPWIVGSLRLLLVAIPLVVVLWMAKRDFDRDMAPLLGKIPAPTCTLVSAEGKREGLPELVAYP